MHSLLEAYLSEVAAQLQPLPAKRREEELREMRAHLLNAVTVHREQGQTEDAAAQSTVAQFGSPEIVGQQTLIAYWRGEAQGTRRLWVTAAWSLGLMQSIPFLLGLLTHVYFNQLYPGNLIAGVSLVKLSDTLLIGGIIGLTLGGNIIGLLFPEKALVGTGYAAIFRFVFGLAMATSSNVAYGFIPLGDASSNLLWWLLTYQSVGSLAAILGAWAGSRWRERQMRLVRA